MKKRWPHSQAFAVAYGILEALQPACERIEIAGSLRRKRPTVGDIEIVYVPWIKMIPDPDDLLQTLVRTNLADKEIARLQKIAVLERRLDANARETFGEQNKLMVHFSGIPVDLFATTIDNWFNYLVCRTGPSALNIKIASGARQHGWKWHPYSFGFTSIRGVECNFRVTCEEDVFRIAGLPYLPPEERR